MYTHSSNDDEDHSDENYPSSDDQYDSYEQLFLVVMGIILAAMTNMIVMGIIPTVMRGIISVEVSMIIIPMKIIQLGGSPKQKK